MLTPRGWGCAAMAATMIFVGRILGIVELMALGGVLLAVTVAAFLVVWLRPLPPMWLGRATRTPFVVAGETARIQLRVMNRGWRTCPTLLLRDHVDDGARRVNVWIAPLEGTERQVGAFRLPTRRRGRLLLGPVEALRVDPLGLVERVVVRGPDGQVIAHPPIVEIDPVLMPWREAALASRRGREGSEFHGLRSYVAGDDLRRVHWPTAARTGDLLVRIDAPEESSRPVLVRVEVRSSAHEDAAAFETALGVAASYVRASTNSVAAGRPVVRLQLGDGPIVTGEPSALETLADARLEPDGQAADRDESVHTNGTARAGLTARAGRTARTAAPGTIAVLGARRSPEWATGADLVIRVVRRHGQEPVLANEIRIGELSQLTSRGRR